MLLETSRALADRLGLFSIQQPSTMSAADDPYSDHSVPPDLFQVRLVSIFFFLLSAMRVLGHPAAVADTGADSLGYSVTRSLL